MIVVFVAFSIQAVCEYENARNESQTFLYAAYISIAMKFHVKKYSRQTEKSSQFFNFFYLMSATSSTQ